MKALLDNLTAKRANLQRSLSQADIRVLVKEREVVEAREARAACQAALQTLDEAIALLPQPSMER